MSPVLRWTSRGAVLAGVLAAAMAGVLAAAGGAGGPASSASQPAGRIGRLVFSSNREGPWRICEIKEDGTGLRQLTKAGEDEHDVGPRFSPDGKAVLFTSTRGDKTGLWVMPAGGGQPKRVCDGDQGDWSPDGKAVVFRREGRIVARALADGTDKTLTPQDWTKCSGPAWSPDGKTIVFATIQGGRNALFLVAAGGGTPAKLYDKEPACAARWSPDGKRIVYETETHVFTIQPDGTGNRMVTYYGGLQRYAQWSPDGKQIVFCQGASTQGPWELYVVAAGGGTPKKLTEGGSDMYPDWR
jgi:TolB protein